MNGNNTNDMHAYSMWTTTLVDESLRGHETPSISLSTLMIYSKSSYEGFSADWAIAASFASPRFLLSVCLPFCTETTVSDCTSHLIPLACHWTRSCLPPIWRTSIPCLLSSQLVALVPPSVIAGRFGLQQLGIGCSCCRVNVYQSSSTLYIRQTGLLPGKRHCVYE